MYQGIRLLERFAQDNHIRIHDPQRNLQMTVLQSLLGGSDSLAHVDAIGELAGAR